MNASRSMSHVTGGGCIELATPVCQIVRRNMLLGLWAGKQLGLHGADLESYAQSAIEADFAEPGHEDLVRKLLGDFVRSGVSADEREIRVQLRAMHLVADRKSTRLNSSHANISYAVFCLKKKK